LKDLLLITPPFTQLNTPYPATAYLKGFLNTKGINCYQMDLGIETILELFSKQGLEKIFNLAAEHQNIKSDNAQRIFALKPTYLSTIDLVIAFLQGSNTSLVRRICSNSFLPQASKFDQLNDMEWAFGNMGMEDKAKHLATLYLEDISDFIVECVDENFGFSRYAERLGKSANSFDELYDHLLKPPTHIDEIALGILDQQLTANKPKLVCISVPFPGNLYSAFRCGQFIKKHYPDIKIAMGGGFPNTELRSLTDVRVFEFLDYITLDDGELPIELLANQVLSKVDLGYRRTFVLEKNKVVYHNNSSKQDYKQAELGTPDYSDLLLAKYISVIEIANPMHSLWSDGKWLKLTMAHGCYWGKCTFCDISLDYIKVYEPLTAKLLVDRMAEMIHQTGERGFHFVDEAAPPALMKALAIEIIRRNLVVSWWTNIRFEKSFTADLCKLLKASGCIAVSGGLEVASDRLLKLIDKGVTVKQVAQVTQNFTEADIMVHSYLMYGYPTQTIQETVDSLEMVRQMFELGILQSGFWHQFALTAHSPVGIDPSAYSINPVYQEISFANNDIDFTDQTGIDHDLFSYGLKKSIYNFMHGVCFEMPLQDWFDFKIPNTKIDPDFIEGCLQENEGFMVKSNAMIIWLGGKPNLSLQTKSKKGRKFEHHILSFHEAIESYQIKLDKSNAEWLVKTLSTISIHQNSMTTFTDLKQDYEKEFEDFELFWYSKSINLLRQHSLLSI